MSRLLDDLDPRFVPIACALIARIIEAKIPLLIVTTLRTLEEQQDAVARGVSWTMNSKHLPQPPHGKSWAIDLVPYAIFDLHGPDKLEWNERDPAFQTMGRIGELLGLKWGVVLAGPRHTDLGHFEWSPDGALPTAAERMLDLRA